MIFTTIISRDDGEPWPPTGMSTARWLTIPTRLVPISDLIATQPGIYFHGLTNHTAVGGDHYPHVIEWEGRLYLEDGHHRTVCAYMNHRTHIQARVLTIPDAVTPDIPTCPMCGNQYQSWSAVLACELQDQDVRGNRR